MPATTGRYATRSTGTVTGRANHHWRWLLHTAIHTGPGASR
jgi:hypothetical protein